MGIESSCSETTGSPGFKESNTPFNSDEEVQNEWLGQNIPNPFLGETEIPYNLPDSIFSAKITIYENVTGRIIKEYHVMGTGRIIFKGEDLGSGIYLYNLMVEDRIIDRKKMILLK